MSNVVDIEHIEREARRAAEAKVAAVRALARARQAHLTAAATLEAAEAADMAAYKVALGHGWTAMELEQFGFDHIETSALPAGSSIDDDDDDESPSHYDTSGYLSAAQ